jgi:hypothetical protein
VMGKLLDKVEKLNLPDKDKLLMTMFPEILSGFIPPNFTQLQERIDCPVCMAMAESFKRVHEMEMPRDWRHLLLPWVRRTWHRQADADVEQVLKDFAAMGTQDKAHWESPEARNISQEFVNAFVTRSNWEYEDE